MASIVYLLFSTLFVFIAFGVGFYLMPIILDAIDETIMNMGFANQAYATLYDDVKTTVGLMIPISLALGVLGVCIKFFMGASARGSD